MTMKAAKAVEAKTYNVTKDGETKQVTIREYRETLMQRDGWQMSKEMLDAAFAADTPDD